MNQSLIENMHAPLFLIVLTVFLFGCSKEQDTTQQSHIAELGQADPVIQTQLNELGRAVVAKKCLNPISIKSEQIENMHDPAITDEIRRIICDGYEIKIYLANFSSPPKELPLELVVNKKLEHIDASQYIGNNANLVIKSYGQPLQIDGQDIIYQLGIEGSEYDFVRFQVKQGLVEKIMWDWDID